MKAALIISNIRSEFHWWRWLFEPLPFEALYFGPTSLDKESRRIIIDRWRADHDARDPILCARNAVSGH
jgi:hypothetical protein